MTSSLPTTVHAMMPHGIKCFPEVDEAVVEADQTLWISLQ